jgi:hypothetical protein
VNVRAAIVAIALIALSPAAAVAADVANLDCPLSRLDAAGQAAVGEGVAQRAPHEDPRIAPLRRAAEQCGQSFGWSTQEVNFAFIYHLSRAGVAGERRWLTGRGFDVDALERGILADTVLMAAIRGDEAQAREALGGFVDRNMPLLERLIEGRAPDTELMERVGGFIGFRMAMEWARGQFAGS